MSQYTHIKKDHNAEYYDQAEEASENIFENPGCVQLRGYLKECKTVLEVGCGSGIKTAQMTTVDQNSSGCDINEFAVNRANELHPSIDFFVSDCLKITKEDNTFDGVYSFFTLEHVDDPQKMVEEMVRVTKPGGVTAIMCPNFGSPLFASPPVKYKKSVGAKIAMYFNRTMQSFAYHMGAKDHRTLKFAPVKPILDVYESDYDTVNEPYLYKIVEFIKTQGHHVEYASSLWDLQRMSGGKWKNIVYLPFRILGCISPFKWWGPQVCIIIKKAK